MNYKVFGVAFENFSSHPQFLFSHIKLRETFPEVFFKAKKVPHRPKRKENLWGGKRNYIEYFQVLITTIKLLCSQ
jgi:hypothetical protein